MKNVNFWKGKGAKTLLAGLAVVLLLGTAIGGTMAWFTASTKTVTNTFTFGDINITLNESKYDKENNALLSEKVQENSDYYVVPGDTIPKDPMVTVLVNSEPCYVFLKVEEKNNTYDGLNGSVIQWGIIDANWNHYKTVNGIYFYSMKVDTKDTQNDRPYAILTDGTDTDATTKISTAEAACQNHVKVNVDVTKDKVSTLNANKPQLIFDAAAVQIANLADSNDETANLSAAWSKLPSTFTGETANSGANNS